MLLGGVYTIHREIITNTHKKKQGQRQTRPPLATPSFPHPEKPWRPSKVFIHDADGVQRASHWASKKLLGFAFALRQRILFLQQERWAKNLHRRRVVEEIIYALHCWK